ncbi:MAG: hypothetical protein PHS48_06580, partial [Bacteroidales bacterium]|nr:hypothetical protein [Bacteroidales bacterium]
NLSKVESRCFYKRLKRGIIQRFYRLIGTKEPMEQILLLHSLSAKYRELILEPVGHLLARRDWALV